MARGEYFSPHPVPVRRAGAQQMEQCSCSRGCSGGRFSSRWERGRIQSSAMKVNKVKPIGPLCIYKIQNKRFSIKNIREIANFRVWGFVIYM